MIHMSLQTGYATYDRKNYGIHGNGLVVDRLRKHESSNNILTFFQKNKHH